MRDGLLGTFEPSCAHGIGNDLNLLYQSGQTISSYLIYSSAVLRMQNFGYHVNITFITAGLPDSVPFQIPLARWLGRKFILVHV